MLRFAFLLGFVTAIQFDNALRDRPRIECGHGRIQLGIDTQKDPPAHVFVKGHYRKEGCSFTNTSTVTLDFAQCDVSRKREIKPQGMSYSLTVVVQLHPLFVTKVDRAFHVKCVYQEGHKNVNSGLDVGELPQLDVSEQAPPPNCGYSLHKDSPNGPVVKYAHVGDAIYHVWDCPSNVYAMLVHSCTALDGHGNEQNVIDENGCSMDDYLIPELNYADDLTKTFTAVSAFNFPDETSMNFNCKIKLCVKGTADCDKITPPRCGIHRDETVKVHDSVPRKDLDADKLLPSPIHDASSTVSFEETVSQSTSSIGTSTTIQPPTTTTESTTSTLIITTHVTEITSTSTEAPSTTTFISSTSTTKPLETTSFPIPPSIDDEGSGIEVSQESSTRVSLIVADEIDEKQIYLRPGDERREIKRRDTVIDMDIASPELMILEKEVGLTEAGEALRLSDRPPPKRGDVCVSLTTFGLLAVLGILCTVIVASVICMAQRQRHKLRLLP